MKFRIFADDTNVFASTRDLMALEQLMNFELKKVKAWWDMNKLPINLSFKSRQKIWDSEVEIKTENEYGTFERTLVPEAFFYSLLANFATRIAS